MCCTTDTRHTGHSPPPPPACRLLLQPSHSAKCLHGNSNTDLGWSMHTTQHVIFSYFSCKRCSSANAATLPEPPLLGPTDPGQAAAAAAIKEGAGGRMLVLLLAARGVYNRQPSQWLVEVGHSSCCSGQSRKLHCRQGTWLG